MSILRFSRRTIWANISQTRHASRFNQRLRTAGPSCQSPACGSYLQNQTWRPIQQMRLCGKNVRGAYRTILKVSMPVNCNIHFFTDTPDRSICSLTSPFLRLGGRAQIPLPSLRHPIRMIQHPIVPPAIRGSFISYRADIGTQRSIRYRHSISTVATCSSLTML